MSQESFPGRIEGTVLSREESHHDSDAKGTIV